MWWKFKRHRLALVVRHLPRGRSTAMILICEFLAPYNLHTRNVDFIYAPPQTVHLFHEGSFRRAVRLRPHRCSSTWTR